MPIFVESPQRVHRFGALGAYQGLRVLVNEGIFEKGNPKGIIIAQFHNTPFCFYRSLYGLKLLDQTEESHKVLTGILWSSLARYYFFMTSANWGLWHHKLLLDELLQLPVIFDKSHFATAKIFDVVNRLINYHPTARDLNHPDGVDENEITAQRNLWERELDGAVFELYDLSEEQKDLVRDFCEVTLPFYYQPFNSMGSMPAGEHTEISWLKENYIDIFSRRWNAYLKANTVMRAHLHLGAHGTMMALEFFPADKVDAWELDVNDNSWQYVLDQIEKALRYPMGTSQIIIDGIVHAVSDDSIIIVKRNERRFWTRSLAREDADITLYKRMVGPSEKDGSDC
ncbi:MAG: hypothetical protein FWF85_09605 [Clostridiales bacterium]|nr:hypothetical protein [Clostridiales bacterium]